MVELNIGILVATFGERIEVESVRKTVEGADEDNDRFAELRLVLSTFEFIHVNQALVL